MASIDEHTDGDRQIGAFDSAEGRVPEAGAACVLSPEEFFEEFTARPDVDRIMTVLAQIDHDERAARPRDDGVESASARAPRWQKNPS